MLKKMIFTSFCLLLTHMSHAVVIYTDFTNDQAYDATYTTTPGTITARVYVSVSNEEFNAHGGLGGFGTNFDADGLNILGASDAEKLANITINPQWNFATSKNVNATDSAEIIGNVLSFPSFTTSPLHLYDVDLVVPAGVGSYVFQLADAVGSSFVADDLFDYDSSAVFQSSTINVVPLPAAAWFFISSLFILLTAQRK